MPANLTPQYSKAEVEYRQAQTAIERVECLEKMLQLIPKHKGTEKLQAELKTRLKETREEVAAEKRAPRPGKSYRVPRQGAGTVVILGGPNSGKSRLLQELTNAHPEVAPYPFTTREPFPAMMPWEDVTVQLIDTPPITAAHMEPSLTGLVRAADRVLLAFDGASDDAPQDTVDVITQLAARKTRLSHVTGFDDNDLTIVTVQALLVVTRGADPDANSRVDFLRELLGNSLPFPVRLVELDRAEATETLRDEIYRMLGMIRVYTKRPGQPAEREAPFSLPHGATVEDLARKVHHDLAVALKSAKIWSLGATNPLTGGRDHLVQDGDVVELHT